MTCYQNQCTIGAMCIMQSNDIIINTLHATSKPHPLRTPELDPCFTSRDTILLACMLSDVATRWRAERPCLSQALMSLFKRGGEELRGRMKV